MRRKIILSIVVLVIGIMTFVVIKDPIVKCSLVGISKDVEEIADDVFVQKDIDEAIKEDLLIYIEEAKNRGKELYGGLKGSPTFIIATDEKLINKYNGYKVGVTHNSFLGQFIIIGPEGMNVDVISHELTHSELYSRVSWIKSFKIPIWFNEGLATQVDYRDRYSIEAWNEITDNGNDVRNIKSLNSTKEFYPTDNNIRRNNYILAKYEVKKWFNKAGTDGLMELIKKFSDGEDLIKVYENIN